MPYFHLSNKIVFLFEEWKTLTLWDHLLFAGAVLIISLLQEVLVAYLKHLISGVYRKRNKRCLRNCLASLIYQFSFIFRYVLMLVVMIHSTLLFAAVLLGSGLGYFILPPIITFDSRTRNSETQNNDEEMHVLAPNITFRSRTRENSETENSDTRRQNNHEEMQVLALNSADEEESTL